MASRGAAARARGATWKAMRWTARLTRGQVVQMVGGPARARVVVLFGCVLALSSADTATIGAVARQLESAMKISNTEIGLLSSASLLVGAIFVLPAGMLVDRSKRIPLLSGSIVLWSAASLASAFAGSFSTLLLTRLALGAVIATAGPAIASLTGDYFPARERGRVYSYILAGEFAGTAIGFVLALPLANLISWRAAFVMLAIPGFFLARSLWRTVPEPRRGGQSHLHPGAEGFDQDPPGEFEWEDPVGGFGSQDADPAHEAAQRHGVAPDQRRVLRRNPRELNMRAAIRYVLSVPTNVMLIASSALGYFFLAGLQTFAVVFVEGHYKVGYASVTLVLLLLVIGSLVGTLVSGRITDTMLRNGMLEARIWIPALCYFGAAALLVPGILASKLSTALWFDVGGATLIAAANPPLDAARLDIMPSGLWGQAESTRTFLRSLAQALAPLLFGGVSDLIAGIFPVQAPVGTHPGPISPSVANGLEVSFMIMLAALVAAGVFLLRARHSYPTDVATAGAYEPEPATRVM
jgi:predicted MFS family arabinose efflux permease